MFQTHHPPFRHALHGTSGHLDFMFESLTFLNSVTKPDGKSVPCLEGWKLSVRALIELWSDLDGFKFLLTSRKELHCVFVDLEKAYDKVPREEVWSCMRKSGLAEKYVRIVQDMYDDSTTAVRCAVGVTEGFEVKMGLHQGSALSPSLFAMMMDRMTDEIREEAPWTMMFADDIVICSESKEQVEDKLESWRYALERRGMKINRK